MRSDAARLLERRLLDWVASDLMTRLLQSVPPEQREALARQAREELGAVLCSAPIDGDPVIDVMARAEIAAAFDVILPDR